LWKDNTKLLCTKNGLREYNNGSYSNTGPGNTLQNAKMCKMLKTENGFQIAQKSENLLKIKKVRSKIYEKIILTVLDILATLCIDVWNW
jgi:hypothetical protein